MASSGCVIATGSSECRGLPSFLEFISYEKSRTSPDMVESGLLLIFLFVTILFLELEAYMQTFQYDDFYSELGGKPPSSDYTPLTPAPGGGGGGGPGGGAGYRGMPNPVAMRAARYV
jgi:hypothetical protein